MSFNCLINTGGKHIPKEVRNKLVQAACDMARHRQKHMRIRSDECTGVIYTSWKRGSMGTIVGTEFVAELALESGDTKITYLMRDFDLEQMDLDSWAGFRSMDEVEQAVAASERAELKRSGKANNRSLN